MTKWKRYESLLEENYLNYDSPHAHRHVDSFLILAAVNTAAVSMEDHTCLLLKNLTLVHISQRMALYHCPLSHINLYHRPPIMHCFLVLPDYLPFKFHCGSAGKESACNAGDLCLIPGLGRSPGEG